VEEVPKRAPGEVVWVQWAGGWRVACVSAVWPAGAPDVDLLQVDIAFSGWTLVLPNLQVRSYCGADCPEGRPCAHCRSRRAGSHAAWCLHGDQPDLVRVLEARPPLRRVAARLLRFLRPGRRRFFRDRNM
jgi:hypothetical protein